MRFSRGMRDKIANYINPAEEISVEMSILGNAVYDFSCFGVDVSGKLSDERYMVFYNQTTSPMNEISYIAENNSAKFNIRLSSLPQSIDKLIFTASIDGTGVMRDISKHSFIISQNGSERIRMELIGLDFKQEKAIISVEIYRKGEWRISAVANGFNGGLSALLAHFGGTEESGDSISSFASQNKNSSNQSMSSLSQSLINMNKSTVDSNKEKNQLQNVGEQVVHLKKNEEELTKEVMGRITLSKDKSNLEKHVVSLSKCVVNLSKQSGVDLGATSAKVVVVLDYSGSMSGLYNNGTVQKTINRLVPLGLTFDDNGSIDVYLFQNDYRKMENLNLTNYENYISNVVKRSGYTMGGTNYAPVLKAIIEGDVRNIGGFLGIGGRTKVIQAIVDNGDPTFILFITDGANADCANTDAIIRKSSEMNVFIQFIGIGNGRFEYLMQLDDMQGRKRDNTGFSKMKALDKVTDDQLYTNVLEQFSQWIKGLQ